MIHFEKFISGGQQPRHKFIELIDSSDWSFVNNMERDTDDFTEIMLMRSMHLFRKNGHQVFQIGPRMTETFEHMNLTSVRPEMLSLPYQTLYIDLPHTTHVMPHGELLDLTGMYVSVDESNWWTISVTYNMRSQEDGLAAQIFDLSMNGWLESGKTFKEYIPVICSMYERRKQYLDYPLSMLFNTLLYIKSENADLSTEEPTKYQRLQRKMDKAKGSRKETLKEQASKVTPLRITNLAPTLESKILATDVQGDSQVKAHWVRGHWKRQRYGKQRSKTKIIQVWPYLRGDGEIDDEMRVYSID